MHGLIHAKTMPSPEALELQCVLRARGMDDVADELLLAAARPQFQAVKLLGIGSVDPPVQASQVPLDHPYASGKAINLGVTTLASAAQATADLVTAGYQYLTLLARIGNATTPAGAAGDLTLVLATYEDDGVTAWPNGAVGSSLTADVTVRAAALGNNMAFIVQRFILAGLDKVNVRLTNNNVGALQGATAIYYLQK